MSNSEALIAPILDFLYCRTPDSWVAEAVEQLEIILNDHAANELKAAQSAMTLIAKNPTKLDVLNKMSRLAREELVHFEQVLKILKKTRHQTPCAQGQSICFHNAATHTQASAGSLCGYAYYGSDH